MDITVAVLLIVVVPANEHTVGQINWDLASLNNCGPIALQVCAVVTGRDLTTADVDRFVATKADGCSLRDLENAARNLGLQSVAVRWKDQCPADGAAPAIIPIVNRKGKRHFVAIAGWQDGKALVVDVPHAPVWVDVAKLREKLYWDGAALHVSVGDATQLGVRRQSNVTVVVCTTLGLCVALMIARTWREGRKK